MLIIVLYCYDIYTRLNKWSYKYLKLNMILKIYDFNVSCKLYLVSKQNFSFFLVRFNKI